MTGNKTTQDLSDQAGEPTDRPFEVELTRQLPTIRLSVRRLRGGRRPFELFRLDCWGDTLLGSKLRGELATGYAILLVVCAFEISAWTLLFNYVFQGGTFTITTSTIAATALGVLWGIGIFTIDKNLIISDLMRPGLGKVVGAASRIALVFGSAYLTAQPIEQLVFRPMINEYLKQDTVCAEAIGYLLSDVSKLDAENGQLKSNKPKADDTEVNKQQKQLDDSDQRLNNANKVAIKAEATKEEADQRARNTSAAWHRENDKDPESQSTKNAYKIAQYAWSAASKATAEYVDAEASLKAAQQERDRNNTMLKYALENYNKTTVILDEQHKNKIDANEATRKRYIDALTKLRSSEYDAPVNRYNDTPVTWKTAGIIERAAILVKARDGIPPQCKTEKPEDLANAERQYGSLASFSSAQGGASGLWLLVMLVAAAIPALSVFYKFTTSRELKMYYSVEHQAAAGNPDAVVLWRAQRRGAAINGDPPPASK